jgi:multiple sugar transport system permease protein
MKMLTDSYVLAAIKNTFIYTLVTVPFQTILALLFAAFLAMRFRNWFGEMIRSAMFIPVIASAVACGAVWAVLMDTDNGLLNFILHFFGAKGINWLGSSQYALISICIVAIWKNVGYFLVIYYAGIMGISRDLFEAAEIDGASKWQEFRLITIPMLKPVTYLIVTLGIIWSFQVFDLSYVMTGGGPGKSTVTLVMDIYNQAFKGNGKMGYASAIAMVLLLFIVIVNLIENRFFKPKEEV